MIQVQFLIALPYIGSLFLGLFVILPIGGVVGGIILIIGAIEEFSDGDGCSAIIFFPMGVAMLIFGAWMSYAVIHDLLQWL